MLLDRMGYILSEAFTLLVVVATTKGILCLRRGRIQRALFSDSDRQTLFQPIRLTARAPIRFLRYALIFALVTSIGAIEIVIFGQFGAAILTGVLLVTCTSIVYWGLSET